MQDETMKPGAKERAQELAGEHSSPIAHVNYLKQIVQNAVANSDLETYLRAFRLLQEMHSTAVSQEATGVAQDEWRAVAKSDACPNLYAGADTVEWDRAVLNIDGVEVPCKGAISFLRFDDDGDKITLPVVTLHGFVETLDAGDLLTPSAMASSAGDDEPLIDYSEKKSVLDGLNFIADYARRCGDLKGFQKTCDRIASLKEEIEAEQSVDGCFDSGAACPAESSGPIFSRLFSPTQYPLPNFNWGHNIAAVRKAAQESRVEVEIEPPGNSAASTVPGVDPFALNDKKIVRVETYVRAEGYTAQDAGDSGFEGSEFEPQQEIVLIAKDGTKVRFRPAKG